MKQWLSCKRETIFLSYFRCNQGIWKMGHNEGNEISWLSLVIHGWILFLKMTPTLRKLKVLNSNEFARKWFFCCQQPKRPESLHNTTEDYTLLNRELGRENAHCLTDYTLLK